MGEVLARNLVTEKGNGTPRTICLYGELGSGKTTFAQGFAKRLGITTRLLSPTFIIVRRYQLFNPSSFFYHIDLYRLEGDKELEGLGLRDMLSEANSYKVIEWAEKLESLLPKRRVDIRLAVKDSGEHTIIIESYYGRSRE